MAAIAWAVLLRVLGRWHGLTPEQPAHCLRGFPECPRAAPSRVGKVTLPDWVGVGEPRGRLGVLYAKNITICPTQACTTPEDGNTNGREHIDHLPVLLLPGSLGV